MKSAVVRYPSNDTRSGSAPPDVPNGPHPCPGIPIYWSSELDIYDTFPWSRLGTTAGRDRFPFCLGIRSLGRGFFAFAHGCAERVKDAKVPCMPCQSIASRVEQAMSSAQSGKAPHKTIAFSPYQLRSRLLDRMQTLNQWKLKVCASDELFLFNKTDSYL